MANVVLIDTAAPTIDLHPTGVLLETFQPNDIKINRLTTANLVLIDFKIDDWDVVENPDIPEIARPADGLALAHSVRRHMRKAKDVKPPAVALITNEYNLAAAPLPENVLRHTLARLNGIEWVFKKDDDAAGIASLANACGDSLFEIVEAVAIEDRLSKLCSYLGVEEPASQEYISDEISYCQPPFHELAKWEDGLLILRWLLHRVLPHPTMLVADTYIAERAQCDLGQVSRLLNANTEFSRSIGEYTGAAAGLFSRRYWRSTLERKLGSAIEGSPSDPVEVRTYLSQELGEELATPPNDQIEWIDSNNEYGLICGDLAASIPAIVDDWPPYATKPWKGQ